LNIQEFYNENMDTLPKACQWVNELLAHYAPEMKAFDQFKFRRIPNYFNQDHLVHVRVVSVDEVPAMPVYSKWGIESLKDFELKNKGKWAGEAYLDTIFIKNSCIEDEGLFFHELVHTIQYKLLGLEHFLLAYGFECATQEYPNGPLELMARSLESKFRNDEKTFDAEEFVRASVKDLKLI